MIFTAVAAANKISSFFWQQKYNIFYVANILWAEAIVFCLFVCFESACTSWYCM